MTKATGPATRNAEGLRGAPSKLELRQMNCQGGHKEGLEVGDSKGVKRISVTEGTWSGAGATCIFLALLFQVADTVLMKFVEN